MSKVGQIERITQNRVVALFQQQLNYRYLGNLEKEENSNLDEALLAAHLTKQGYSSSLISKALFEFKKKLSPSTATTIYIKPTKMYIPLFAMALMSKKRRGKTKNGSFD